MNVTLPQCCVANGREDKWSEGEGSGGTGAKETGGKETRVKAMGVRETGGKVSGGKATGAQVSQETGRKGDRLMGERETDNSLPGDKAAGQNVMEGIQRKSYYEAVIEGVRKRVRVFVRDSIVRKTDSLKQGRWRGDLLLWGQNRGDN